MKIHLSAVCGTAMASLAGLLRERGHELSGSDQDVYPPMSTQLEALGIPILSPYAESNVPADADLVVIGNALSRGNPEVEVVLERRQRFTSLPALLAEEFLRPRQSLVVAGTHGKTTTTSLLAFLLERAGLDPSFLIGGVPVDFERSYRLGGGPHFVIEGDEYDCAFFDKRPKFVHYLPNLAIIGNVEYDHADIYPDLAAVQLAFVRLMQVVPRNGLLIAGSESPALQEILKHARCRVETFGLQAGADWRAVDVRSGSAGARFRLIRAGRDEGELTLPLAGEHNVRNALAALAAAARGGRLARRGARGAGGVPGGQAPARAAGRGSRESASTTTSRTIRRRWPQPSPRCAAPAVTAGWWPCSSHAPTRRGPASSRTTSRGRSPGPTTSSSRRRTCRARCRKASASRSASWSPESVRPAATPCSSPRSTRSSRTSP